MVRPQFWLGLGATFAVLLVAQVGLGLFSPLTDPAGAFSEAPLASAPEVAINTVLGLNVLVGVLLMMGFLQVYRATARKAIRAGKRRKRR